jgi:hypothetical protein
VTEYLALKTVMAKFMPKLLMASHRIYWTQQWPQLHEHHNYWWQLLGVRQIKYQIRCQSRSIFLGNEKLTRVPHTTSLKRC